MTRDGLHPRTRGSLLMLCAFAAGLMLLLFVGIFLP